MSVQVVRAAPLGSYLQDSKPIQLSLIRDGWRSPDTYSNHFAPVESVSGVYLFLLHEREEYRKAFIAYVGMSKNLEQRLSSHEVYRELEDLNLWIMRWFKELPCDELRKVERDCIGLFNPPWNIIGKRKGIAL